MTIEQREAELIDGFLTRRPSAELSFLSELRPLLRAEVRIHWTGLWRHLDDLEQGALLKLCELRETDAGRKTIRPPLTALAKMLIEGPARKLRREKKPGSLEDWDEAVEPNQETVFEIHRLREIATRLPPGLAAALECHLAHLAGDGPPVHVALGLSKNTARMRVTRAQDAVLAIANGEKDEVEDE